MNNLNNKYLGCLVGLAIGDTLGAVAEFMEPGEFEPITEPRAGGPFRLPVGYWTDDTSMALCLADSFIQKQGYDSFDIMQKFWLWRSEGYRSSTGVCFDVGNQTSASINEFMSVGRSVINKDKKRSSSAGNGSIMRLAPLVIASHAAGNTLEKTMLISQLSARETHYSYEAEAGTALFAAILYNAVESTDKNELLNYGDYELSDEFTSIASAVAGAKSKEQHQVEPTGYIVNSLIAAVWALMTTDTFEAGALRAVNLGGDADTIGAIYGQIAGAFYGYEAIPSSWRTVLHQEQDIVALADKLANFKKFEVLITRFEEDGTLYSRKPEINEVQGDITELDVDAIVNAANTELVGGSGVSGAIFDGAGYEHMTKACQEIGGCEYGEAVITPGFKLAAKHVIHTVGPVYGQHGGDEADILSSCYWQSLRLTQDYRLKSVAFPLISTGIYGYPKEEAAEIAVSAIKEFFEDNKHTSIEKVIIVAYEGNDYDLIEKNL